MEDPMIRFWAKMLTPAHVYANDYESALRCPCGPYIQTHPIDDYTVRVEIYHRPWYQKEIQL